MDNIIDKILSSTSQNDYRFIFIEADTFIFPYKHNVTIATVYKQRYVNEPIFNNNL